MPPLEKNISSEQKGKERLHKSAGRRSSGGDEVIDSHGVQSFKDRGKKNKIQQLPSRNQDGHGLHICITLKLQSL